MAKGYSPHVEFQNTFSVPFDLQHYILALMITSSNPLLISICELRNTLFKKYITMIPLQSRGQVIFIDVIYVNIMSTEMVEWKEQSDLNSLP